MSVLWEFGWGGWSYSLHNEAFYRGDLYGHVGQVTTVLEVFMEVLDMEGEWRGRNHFRLWAIMWLDLD